MTKTDSSSLAVKRLAGRLAITSHARAERLNPSLPAVQRLAQRLAMATLQAQAERVSVRTAGPVRSVRLRVRSRSRAPRARRVRRSSCRTRGPDDSGSEPGSGPSWDADESFSDEEARAVARSVVSGSGASLTPERFYAITSTLLLGLEGGQLANARLRVFCVLPDRLRRSFYASLRAHTDRESDRQLRFGQEGGAE
jgi:hypothetical protein